MAPYGRSRATGRRAGLVAASALGLLAATCGGNGSPTAPPSTEPPAAFVMIAGINVLAIGQTTPFTATAYPGLTAAGLGPMSDVTRQCNWASSNPAVATVSSAGLATGRSPGTTEIAASCKGMSYSVPLLVIGPGSTESLSRYVGTWSGEATMTCQRLSGSGRSVCDSRGIGTPDTYQVPIELTLSLAPDVLSGTLRVFDNPRPA